MSSYFYKQIPAHSLARFRPVRDASDNVENLANLAEIINTCHHCLCDPDDDSYDLAIFSGRYRRALIKKRDGYFSMGIPFQLVNEGDALSFNMDLLSEPVSGRLISLLRNASLTWRQNPTPDDVSLSLCENFGIGAFEATNYCNAFLSLLSEDHGYFRFDDDPGNENGDLHPRYHYDFFFKNSTSVKIGSEILSDIRCFYALCDAGIPKRYLREP